MSNPKMGPNETISGLELLMRLSHKDRDKIISSLRTGRTPHRSGLQDPAETLAYLRETAVILNLWPDAATK